MQDTFDDNKEESNQDIQDNAEKSKLGEVVCGSRMLNGKKMKEGKNDMEVSQSNNNMDGENMKKISDDEHTVKDGSQDGKNSEVINSNCVAVQINNVYSILHGRIKDKTQFTVAICHKMSSMLYKNYSMHCGLTNTEPLISLQ